MGLDVLTDVKQIALDTNIFIYALEQHPEYGEIVRSLLKKVEQGEWKASVSTISLNEILVKPIREGNDLLERRYKLLFTHFPNLALIPVHIEVAEHAAYLRGKYGLKSPDSFVLASAVRSGAEVFITNDQRLEKVDEIRIISITQLVSQS